MSKTLPDLAPLEAPPPNRPLCPFCKADPLLPMARELRLPFAPDTPPAVLFLVWCQRCRKLIPSTYYVYLGVAAPDPSQIVTPKNVSVA